MVFFSDKVKPYKNVQRDLNYCAFYSADKKIQKTQPAEIPGTSMLALKLKERRCCEL